MLLKSYIIYRYLESPKPQKPWKTKKKQSQKSWGRLGNPKNKTLRRMSGFDSKDFLFVFPRFCLFLVGFNSQPWVFLHTYYQPISQKTKNSSFFWLCFFCYGLIWFQKPKKSVFCFLHICYQPISPKNEKNSRFFFFCCYGLIWFQKPKAKKNLSFCFLHTCYQRYLKKNSGVFCLFAFVVMVWYVMQYLIQRVPDTLRKKWGQWGML